MNYKRIAIKTYEKFLLFDGNDYIASEYALISILKLIKKFKVESVLEIGMGIGSIADSVLEYSKSADLKIDYTGTEANEFCLNALKTNVADYKKIHLYNEISDIENLNNIDFIIIDGGDESLEKIKTFCSKNTIVFVEGLRSNQVNLLKETFPKAIHVEIISTKRVLTLGSKTDFKWSGGGQLIFLEPSFFRKNYALYEKINSFLKRRIRRFKM